MSGLSYNKCKQPHEIPATVFEVMHFRTFLDLQEDKEEKLEIKSNQITLDKMLVKVTLERWMKY